MNLEERKYQYKLKYNGVIIIQSLRQEDSNKTGEKLFKYTVEPKCKERGLFSKFFDIQSKTDFYELFEAIILEVTNGRIFPLLHFEMHAGEAGLQLGNMEYVSWQDLGLLCRKINYHLKNELIVTLATCKGAYFYQSLDIRLPAPFWCYIGAKNNIEPSDLLRDYTGFYNVLLGSGDLQAAVDALQDENLSNRYVYLPVEYVFDELSDALNMIQPTKTERFENLLPSMRELNPTLNEQQVRNKLWENINNHNEDQFRENIKRNFLMK